MSTSFMQAIEASITQSILPPDPMAQMQSQFMSSIITERNDARVVRKTEQIMQIGEKIIAAKESGADESTLRALRSCLAYFESQ